MKGRVVEAQILVLVTLGLVAFGLVMVYSATSAAAALGNGDPSYFLKRQGVYAVLGIAVMLVASRIEFRLLRRLAPFFLIGSFALCLLVLMAPPVNGARRWLAFGPLTFQPSELAKLSLAIWVAAYLSRRRPPETLSELARPIGVVSGLLCLLILAGRDLGTTISLVVMLFGLLLVSGVPGRVLAVAGGILVSVAALAVVIEPYRRERFFSFLDPWSDPQNSGFQSVQALNVARHLDHVLTHAAMLFHLG